jgi:hypothetical protein
LASIPIDKATPIYNVRYNKQLFNL